MKPHLNRHFAFKFFSFNSKVTVFFTILLAFANAALAADVVYVDSISGNDNNPGTETKPFETIAKAIEVVGLAKNDVLTIKLNPGIHVLHSHQKVATQKDLKKRRITIEASILPDSSDWNPEKMPVIVSSAPKGEFPEKERWVVAFLVEESHVSFRGLKFLGYAYPNTQYFPIVRRKMGISDLSVEQSMFVADAQSSVIQVGVLAHGNGISVDHCVFYKANNAIVYYLLDGEGPKSGNRFTNSIVYGASEAAIWTSFPDKDFEFANNLVANGNTFWKRFYKNDASYLVRDSIVVGNQEYHLSMTDNGDKPGPKGGLVDKNVIHEGSVSLRILENVFGSIPRDYLHPIKGTLGADLGAGIFNAPVAVNSSSAEG